jgi:hypothetical protein
MARNVRLHTLRTRIRELGEIRESYVTNVALDREIESSRLELLDKLVSAGAGDYLETSTNISIVAGTDTYALPTNFYVALAVDVKTTTGTNYATMKRYSWGERNRLEFGAGVDRTDTRYRIHGDNIKFKPTPTWTETNSVLLTYVPVPATLLANANTAVNAAVAANTNVDGVFGWDDWIVYDCLIKFVGGKEEGDASEWQGLLAKLNARIEDMRMRDRHEPDTVRNVEDEHYNSIRMRYGG